MKKINGLIEIIFIGRGGQGVVTGAQLAGAAAFNSGAADINVVPFFGAERRGAPVEAYLRLSNEKIFIYSNIEQADIIIVFDESLINNIQEKRIKDGKTVIVVNSADADIYKKLSYYPKLRAAAVIDAAAAAKSIDLYVSGALIINTAMIGAFAAAADLFDLDSIEKSFLENFGLKNSKINFEAAKLAFNNIKITELHK